MSLRNSTLLYRPALSVWTARKLDKTQSVLVAHNADAKEGVANVHKNLLPECKELEDVTKWATQFRTFIYTSTLPWDDSGWRIGQVARHMEFMQEIGDRINLGNLLVDALMRVYQSRVEDAKFTLNKMFNPMDYPSVQEVRSRFSFAVSVMPMPAASDFRAVEGIPKAEVEKLEKAAAEAVEQRIAEAMKEAYERLYEAVAAMANTLDGYDGGTIKKFNDSLVGNIAKIVKVMPALNLTNDPKLAALASDAEELANYAAMDLRQHAPTREAAINEARKLQMKFKGSIAASLPATGDTKVKAPKIKAGPRPAQKATPVGTKAIEQAKAAVKKAPAKKAAPAPTPAQKKVAKKVVEETLKKLADKKAPAPKRPAQRKPTVVAEAAVARVQQAADPKALFGDMMDM
jgi:hypothetical protein